jgi:hypothetical protein
MSANLLLVPTIGLPIASLLRYNNQQDNSEDRVPNQFLLKTWIASGFIGSAVASAAQVAMAWPAGKLVFGSQWDQFLEELGRSGNEVKLLDAETLAFRKKMAFSIQNLTAGIFLSTLAPLTEEIFKYAAIRMVERYFPEKVKTKRNYAVIAMAIGLGFALVENLAFIAAAMPEEVQAQLALTIVLRGIFGTSGHLLTAALTGCKFAQSRDPANTQSNGMWSIIKESMLYHGLGNFGLFMIVTAYGHVGFVYPTDPIGWAAVAVCALGVNAVAAWRVVQEISCLDKKSSQKSS